jgi:hypothetical protein
MNSFRSKPFLFSSLLLFIFAPASYAQFTQSIRGTVVDQVLQSPVAGATVTLSGGNKTVATDVNGNFRFIDVPVGSYQLHISYVGFREATMENVAVNAGKETVLTVPLEVNIVSQKEVVVRANSKKNKPLNEMSAVSARAFTVEETQKYAAAVNDPLRMATGFAGVIAANDGSNDIVIRGNSPTGLLWRMEGVDIPNPNHFSSVGSSGGGISILSAQLLSNSDFITGAFAAEYGNALSGVFDLKLRKGNNERREYTLQAGLLGLNAAAEGPLNKHSKGSFLVNYRYSTLSLLKKIGVEIVDGSTDFQDISYNIYVPTRKAGTFTFFGFGGLSSQKVTTERDSSKWKELSDRYPSAYKSNTGAGGITHSILLGGKTNLKSAVVLSHNATGFDEDYVENDMSLSKSYKDDYKTTKWTVSSTVNHKPDNKNVIRGGVIVNFISFNYYQHQRENPYAPLEEVINTSGNTQTVQAFAQWQYKPANNISFNAGLHYLQLLYNNSFSLEPRGSVKWDISRRNSISFGYGLHSQVQPLGVYFAQEKTTAGALINPNKQLDLSKSHHFVLSHSFLVGQNLRLKTELYYQQLFNVPVSTSDTNTFSTLNILGDYVTDALINNGKGRNYGIEISLEKYLSNNFYYMISNSFYQSRYTASDGIERDTRFNGHYVNTIMAGKDYVSADKRRTFGINIKTILAGGFRNTPIDLAKSQQQGYAVYRLKEAFTVQNDAYFRTDLRVSIKWNRKNLTSTLSLDLQNLTNRQNVYNIVYDRFKKTLKTNYQTGLIPILNYKVEL